MFGKRIKMPTLKDARTRLRGFILDAQLEDPHEIAVALGCPPISDEVAEREEEESDKRIERISHLSMLMYAYSHSIADGVITAQRDTLEESIPLPPEVWKYAQSLMEEIAYSALMGATSQLVDMGYLQVTKRTKKGGRK